MTTKQYWSEHVAAVKSQAISTRAYAQQHSLALSTLYYWQHKLKTTAVMPANSEPTTATRQPSKFVALHVKAAAATARPIATHCTLVLSGGMHLEMQALPEPQWLIDLARCAQGVH